MLTIGERIRELREEKGITQRELAKAMNVCHQVVGYWENNERKLKSDTISALAEYFNVSTDYLLGKPDLLTIDRIIEQENELIEAIDGMITNINKLLAFIGFLAKEKECFYEQLQTTKSD